MQSDLSDLEFLYFLDENINLVHLNDYYYHPITKLLLLLIEFKIEINMIERIL